MVTQRSVVRFVRIWNCDRKGVGEDRTRLVEADAVLLQIASLLADVPLEPDGHAVMEASRFVAVKPNIA